MAKQTQASVGVQRELPLLQAFEGGQLEEAPWHLVTVCRTHLDAVRLCMRLSRVQRTYEDWAALLGLSKGNLSLLLNGGSGERKRYLDPALFETIQVEAGNRAISQYFEALGKGMLQRQQMERFAREAI